MKPAGTHDRCADVRYRHPLVCLEFPLPIARLAIAALALLAPVSLGQQQKPHILQRPALSGSLIAFNYAGDLWTVPREGGRATRLTSGVGIETSPIFSPDGQTIAFSGDYDGNTDVFTIPATGGIPRRITFHPAADVPVGFSADGQAILFRSNRASTSRYTQIFSVPIRGGLATPLPLPMAYDGKLSPDAGTIAYSPLPQAFDFQYTSYVAWGNYHGGRAGTINLTTLPGLDTVIIPHTEASDLSPAWLAGKVYFLSGRKGPITLFRYDPASKSVDEVLPSQGPDLHSLSAGPNGLVYDQRGEIYMFDPATNRPHLVSIDVTADLPEVRSRISNVAGEIENVALSPTGLRIAVEAHGEILTVPAKEGPTRNLTNSPGAMDREPAWSPDGQSIAFFSDQSPDPNHPGLYHLTIAPQTGSSKLGQGQPKIFPLAPDPAFYFAPLWSPDSKRIVFHDNHNRTWMLDTTSGKLTQIGEPDTFGGFSSSTHDVAWSPDSQWIAYPRSMPNHLHAMFLYSVATGQSTQLTSAMGDARHPAFDRNGKFLFFTASTNSGATSDGLDMSSDLYNVTSGIYAAVLAADQASPVAPDLDDEKSAAEAKEKAKDNTDTTPAGEAAKETDEAKKDPAKPADKPKAPKPTRIDLPGIQSRIVPLPLPLRDYTDLMAGKPGTLYFLEQAFANRFDEDNSGATLFRYVFDARREGKQPEKLAENVDTAELSADGEKLLLTFAHAGPPPSPGATPPPPSYHIVPANAPVKAGEGAVSLAQVEVRIEPEAEWRQMFHEVWRIERAFFYDPNFHGTDTVAAEREFEPYVESIASRSDLNYIFQEMLSAFSVGHLRGNGGAIPAARKVPGGLLGADYVIQNNRYCLAKIYTGGDFNPEAHAPLAQPALNLHPGDCILAINGADLVATTDIQQLLEGTAGHVIALRVSGPGGQNPRDLNVIPIPSEYNLRNTDWIDGNQRKVDQISGGKLAYVYLPDTAAGGFTNFNRYFMAQTEKKGAVIDERFNGGGQIADYIVEVMKRQIVSFWVPRYGAIEHTPNAGIYGPKTMIVNEFSGSGGDAMPWLFRHEEVGPLVGKRTWGGLVGIGQIPILMDGGHVTSPSVAFFSPAGKWEVENHGVEPDVVVEQDPKAVSEGHDPQLERAVALTLENLSKHPQPEPSRPAYPNYHP